MNAHPLDRLGLARVSRGIGIKSCCGINFCNLSFTRNGSLLDLRVAVHTYINGGDICLLSLHGAGVAVFTFNFILAGMNLMGESDGLLGLIMLLYADRVKAINHRFEGHGTDHKNYQKYKTRASGNGVEGYGRNNNFTVFRAQLLLLQEVRRIANSRLRSRTMNAPSRKGATLVCA